MSFWSDVIDTASRNRERIIELHCDVRGGYPRHVRDAAVEAAEATTNRRDGIDAVWRIFQDWEHNESAWDRLICGVAA